MPLPMVERSQKEIEQSIRKRIEAIKDVRSCRQVSVDMTGKKVDVSMNIMLDSKLSFKDVHKFVSNIEREVKSIVPNARVTVQTESLSGQEDIWRLVKEIAEGVPGSRGAHNIHIQTIHGKLCIDLHLEVSANMTVKQAHDISDQVERRLREANPNISEITVHMESASDLICRELTGVETELKWYIEHAAMSFPAVKAVHGIKIRKIGDTLHVVLQCHFNPDITMKQAHEITEKLESSIKSVYPNIDRIDVHEEPD